MRHFERFTLPSLIALSIGIGTGIGVALHNIGAGIGTGVTISAILCGAFAQRARRVELSLEDRLNIGELLALHGHLMDAGAFDRLSELFTEDIIYDVSSMGGERLSGISSIVEAAIALGEKNPVAHHTTNVLVLGESPDGTVKCRSKGIAVFADGKTGSVVYEDELRLTARGWRISARSVLPRLRPLQG